MSIFKSMTTEGLEQSEDRLGGYQVLDSGIYEGVIKAFYAGQSSGGATNVTLILQLANGTEYRETIYITSKPTEEQKKKGLPGNNYFINKSTGKKSPLPGFTIINDLCLIAVEKELHEVDVEEKTVNVWDSDAKKELPKAVPMATELIGKKVAVGILKQLENKRAEVNGEYVDTAETREVNSIDKVFHPELRITVAEAREGKTEPKFWDAWLQRNEGRVRDRRTIKDGVGAKAGIPPKPGASGGTPAPRKSLFGK